MPQDLRIGVGVACLVTRDGPNNEIEVLLGKRKGSHGAGLWSTPGGWLDFGETFWATAVRELNEEVGLRAITTNDRVPEPFYVANHMMEGRQFVTIYFSFHGPEEWIGDPKLLEPDKCEEWRWFDTNKLPKEIFPSVDIAVKEAVSAILFAHF